MPLLLWDASALVKRYLIEAGSGTVDVLWASPGLTGMVTTYLGYVETAAILRRKHNGGILNQAAFHGARFLLQQEVLNAGNFLPLPVDAAMPGALVLIDRHNINASDAAILAALLRYASSSGETCLLLAADLRLLRAASAEGLAVLNPETLPAADVPAFLASL